jgi:hypothetical protein
VTTNARALRPRCDCALDLLVSLTAAAECLEELDECGQLAATGLRLENLRLEQLALRIQHFYIRRLARVVADLREPARGVARRHFAILGGANEHVGAARHERVFHIRKRGLDRADVIRERLSVLAPCEVDLPLRASRRKDGLEHRRRCCHTSVCFVISWERSSLSQPPYPVSPILGR